MGRLRFIQGAAGIVAGFFVYQYGFFLTLDLSPSLSGWSLSFVPWMGSLAIMGAALQLVGGVIAIAGLLLCIAWVGSQPKAKSAPGERSPKPALAPVRKCRFCDAPMEPDASFCPKCQRSQA